MLRVFYGNDTVGVRERVFEYVTELLATPTKTQDYISIDTDSYQPGSVVDAISNTSLFTPALLYVIDTPSAHVEFKEEVLANIKALAESANHFVVIEQALLAPQKKQYAKYAESIEEYVRPATGRFNVFGLGDALARKDKKTLWTELTLAHKEGVTSEEIIGILWWQLKTLHLASCTTSAEEAGMKAFPYKKAKQALNRFREDEPMRLAHSLLSLYHDARLGICELDLALERWVLSL